MSFFDDFGEVSEPSTKGEQRRARRRSGNGGRAAFVALLLSAAVLVGAYAALGVYAEDRAPLGASVAGVDIGGMAPAEADTKLRAELEPRLRRPVTLRHGEEDVVVVPADVGIGLDYPATLREVGAHTDWRPEHLWSHYTRSRDTSPVLDVDEAALTSAFNAITSKFAERGVEGTIDFSKGVAKPVYGRSGLRVDRDAMLALLREQLTEPRLAELPTERSDPHVSSAAVRRAMRHFAEPAMSAPVVLRIGPASVIAPPDVVGQALTMLPNEGQLQPIVDGTKLIRLLKPQMTTVGAKPRAAGVEVVDGKLTRIPAVIAAAFDASQLDTRLIPALTKPIGQRVVTVKAAIQQPRITDRVVTKWGIREPVAGFRVRIDQPDAGIRAAVEGLDNKRIPPGGSLSYLKSVGSDEQSSTVAGALFNAAFAMGLGTQQTSALVRDARFPLGGEIRVDAEHDLRVTNDTPYSVLVSATLNKRVLDVRLWSTRWQPVSIKRSAPYDVVRPQVERQPPGTCEPSAGQTGFSVAVTRTVKAPRSGPRTERTVTTYPPKNRAVC